jgi:hypothetical protein
VANIFGHWVRRRSIRVQRFSANQKLETMAKLAKQRQCPAVGREIPSAECGENRASRYACPAECPYNPFAPANYNAFLEVERRADDKALGWLKRNAPDPVALERGVERGLQSRSITELNAFLAWQMYFQRDREGRTVAERWVAQGLRELNNDERVVIRARAQMRTTLIEVRRVLDNYRTEAVDLWAPETPPFVIQDKATASVAVRFVPFVCSLYTLPHYSRLSGGALQIQDMAPWEPLEIVAEQARHLSGPTDGAHLGLWLAEHFVRFRQALTATSLARRQRMMASVDAVFGKAIYVLRAPFEQCRLILDQTRDLLSEPPRPEEKSEGFAEARVWLDDEDKLIKPMPGSHVILGRVLLSQSHWRLEAMGATRLAKLRARFEKRLGDRVGFCAERRDDVGAQFAAEDPAIDQSLVASRLLEGVGQVVMFSSIVPVSAESTDYSGAGWRAAQDHRFPDSPLGDLDGRTPRDAASDPALRPKLIRLLKARVRSHDEENLRTGGKGDINWLLRELGMNEILFDPPPWRPPTDKNAAAYNDMAP